jgi:hypothetical protein
VAFVTDTFTAADGTALTSHTGELGATWTLHPAYAGGAEIKSNRVWGSTAGGSTITVMMASGAPGSADYDVLCDVYAQTGITDVEMGGVVGRAHATNDDGYHAFYYSGAGGWRLDKLVGGSRTTLDLFVAGITQGVTYALKLEMRGSAIKVYVDGVQRISVTDSSITAAGKAGAVFREGSATVGLHLDNFSAVDAGGAPAFVARPPLIVRQAVNRASTY